MIQKFTEEYNQHKISTVKHSAREGGGIMKCRIDCKVCWQRIKSQIYIIRDDKFILLNESASLIWMGIYQGKTTTEIAKDLYNLYGTDFSVILDDVSGTVNDLISAGATTMKWKWVKK